MVFGDSPDVVYFAEPYNIYKQSNVRIGSRSYLVQLNYSPVTRNCVKASLQKVALTTSNSVIATPPACSSGYQLVNNSCVMVSKYCAHNEINKKGIQ